MSQNSSVYPLQLNSPVPVYIYIYMYTYIYLYDIVCVRVDMYLKSIPRFTDYFLLSFLKRSTENRQQARGCPQFFFVIFFQKDQLRIYSKPAFVSPPLREGEGRRGGEETPLVVTARRIYRN